MPRKKIHEDRTMYKNQFIAENYDRINLTVPKGKKKQIQEHVKRFTPRLSVNEYINKLIDFDMQKDED
jgi:hypothetical protein